MIFESRAQRLNSHPFCKVYLAPIQIIYAVRDVVGVNDFKTVEEVLTCLVEVGLDRLWGG